MCVQHPYELALVTCPLFTWIRKPQKAEPTTRVYGQVAELILASDSREQEWETERRETEKVGKPTQAGLPVDSGLRPWGALCGAVQNVPRSGPA